MPRTTAERPRRRTLSTLGLAMAALASLVVANPARAHGTGLVELCERNNNAACTTAVFAVCDPKQPPAACSSVLNPSKGPRDIEIRVSNFPASTTVYLWWLVGSQATDPTVTDCSQAAAMNRISLGSVTTDSTGKAEVDETLPRASWTTPSQWLYGPNWVCGTTVTLGGTGTVGDRMFTIYPV